MQKYRDIDNDSGVDRFKIKKTSIIVKFIKSPKLYTYSYDLAGQYHVEKMKQLALSGEGLNAYINHNVKTKFDR